MFKEKFSQNSAKSIVIILHEKYDFVENLAKYRSEKNLVGLSK